MTKAYPGDFIWALYATPMEQEGGWLCSGYSSSTKLLPGPKLHQGPGEISWRNKHQDASEEDVGGVGRESWSKSSCGWKRLGCEALQPSTPPQLVRGVTGFSLFHFRGLCCCLLQCTHLQLAVILCSVMGFVVCLVGFYFLWNNQRWSSSLCAVGSLTQGTQCTAWAASVISVFASC